MSASVSDIYGSAHDPLCFVNNLCVECHCDLIAKVRKDERFKAELHNYQSGYLAALDATEQAVTEALKERMLMSDCSPNTMRAPLLAIRALKEKP